MDVLETVDKAAEPLQHSRLFRICMNSTKRNEVLSDKCQEVFYVIDNSGSMRNCDGKAFELDQDGRIHQMKHITRWTEAGSKTRQISTYNIHRNIRATYYLLNPRVAGQWIQGQDRVTVDPTTVDSNTGAELETLEVLLQDSNIRGATPLDRIVSYFNRCLREEGPADAPVCFNLITDGEPNNKAAFERELKTLANSHEIFLTVNLCTDDDAVVEYYNDLDKNLGE